MESLLKIVIFIVIFNKNFSNRFSPSYLALSVQSITGFWLGNKMKFQMNDVECKMTIASYFKNMNSTLNDSSLKICPGIVFSTFIFLYKNNILNML
jgi:hypothetical protein